MTELLHEDISILVVDDHHGMLQTLTDILKDEDYQVAAAESGIEAIELCQQNEFDIILMDVKMPGLNGVETMRRIKSYITNTRVIMMSAYSVDELKQESLRTGAVAFLQKPIDVEAVIKIIEQVKQPSILLVSEDEREMSTLMTYLNRHNYRAYATQDIKELISLTQQIHFSVIITDTDIVTNDGMEIRQILKEVTPRSLLIVLDETNWVRSDNMAVSGWKLDAVSDKSEDTSELVAILDEFRLQQNTENYSEYDA